MDTNDAYRMAKRLMLEHGLITWRFEFDRSVKRFGACHYSTRRITLSRPLTEINFEAEVRETILHELAHALTPGRGHGPEWRAMARKIGSNAKRTHTAETPSMRYEAICPTCDKVLKRARKSAGLYSTACGTCCRKYAGGKWDARFVVTFIDTQTGLAMTR